MHSIDDLYFSSQELHTLNARLNEMGLELVIRQIERRGRKPGRPPALERQTKVYGQERFAAGPTKYWKIIRKLKRKNDCSTAEAKKIYEADPDRYLGHGSRSKYAISAKQAKQEPKPSEKQPKPSEKQPKLRKLQFETEGGGGGTAKQKEASKEFWKVIRRIAAERNITNKEALQIYKANKEQSEAADVEQNGKTPHKLTAYWDRVRAIAKKENIDLAAARLRLKEM